MAFGQILSLPNLADGLTFTTGIDFAFTAWQELKAAATMDMLVIGISWSDANSLTNDETTPTLIELGIGGSGSEVTKLQFPYVERSDSKVGYYLNPQTMFLPEPYLVQEGRRLSARVACLLALNVVGLKVFYREGGNRTPTNTIVRQAVKRAGTY